MLGRDPNSFYVGIASSTHQKSWMREMLFIESVVESPLIASEVFRARERHIRFARVDRPPFGLKTPEAPRSATTQAERRSYPSTDFLHGEMGAGAKFLGRIVG
jgi:hypothetical protein